MTGSLAKAPPVRGGERGEGIVPGIRATRRDLRWHRHILRGTAAAIVLLAWLGAAWLNVAALGRTAWPVPVLMAAVVLWWATGVANLVRRGEVMGRAMADAVTEGMAVWRGLPEPDRGRAERVARGLLAAGERRDVDAVRLRLGLLNRAAAVAQARPEDWDDDVDELDAWLDGAEETRR